MKSTILKCLLLFFLPLTGLAISFEKIPVERDLNSAKWQFRKKANNYWLPAKVPGTVHTDLFANNKIPDPFYGNNEKQLQWIENEDWEYRTVFPISAKEIGQPHIELQFDGLDTYANVYVNDSLVLSADNMFRSWNVDVKKYVHEGKNKLLVVFESAVRKGKAEAAKLSYVLPGDEKVFTRKAQYQYGWDWGPRFVTCGIWKNVKLITWNELKVNKVQFIQDSIINETAYTRFEFNLVSDFDGEVTLSDYFSIPIPGTSRRIKCFERAMLKKGINNVTLHCEIPKAILWWCNGMGMPYLYQMQLQLNKGDFVLYKGIKDVGLRTIELIQDKDSIGKSFYFKLNGVPVFMKGANYIPSDNFLPRTAKYQYQEIVRNAVDANMNMLRVWGGGVYADDAFYDACDKNGILVWQDFMFACAMYPGDDHFVNNVAAEVIDQVECLRNHPSIALWCGNNEVDEGWKNWGWQKQFKYSEKDSTTIAQNNAALFNYLINDLVKLHDGTRPYWPSSPSIGWGHKESLLEGDSHYWGVWWGMEPFENYEKKVGRFVSEYGFQGMPSMNTMYKYGAFKTKQKGLIHEDEYVSDFYGHRIDSTIFKAHQKHPSGYQTIAEYMKRSYKVPHKLEDYIYVSQVLQAEGMRIAIEAHRRAKPYCMGTLYWQMNDCWPVTSWSSLDYYNNWKASFYHVKRSYKDVIISVEEKQDSCNIFVVSDLTKNENGELTMELFDLKGKLLFSKTTHGVITANSSVVFCRFDKSLIKNYNINDLVLKCSLKSTDNYISDAYCTHYFTSVKNLNLQKPNISVTFDYCEQVQCFTLETDVVAKNVFNFIEGESVNLSDNYFDLLPGERKNIYLPRMSGVKNFKKKIVVKSLIDTY
ncbi:MAG: glycoside hydrolase family 2 protein [Bacteroidetes bacterium]|nr:glycoside hydrolase family 2 protein [Bacteroidota bacterium]